MAYVTHRNMKMRDMVETWIKNKDVHFVGKLKKCKMFNWEIVHGESLWTSPVTETASVSEPMSLMCLNSALYPRRH